MLKGCLITSAEREVRDWCCCNNISHATPTAPPPPPTPPPIRCYVNCDSLHVLLSLQDKKSQSLPRLVLFPARYQLFGGCFTWATRGTQGVSYVPLVLTGEIRPGHPGGVMPRAVSTKSNLLSPSTHTDRPTPPPLLPRPPPPPPATDPRVLSTSTEGEPVITTFISLHSAGSPLVDKHQTDRCRRDHLCVWLQRQGGVGLLWRVGTETGSYRAVMKSGHRDREL